MEYKINISLGNMSAVSINVEADNVLDALENKLQLLPAYQELDKNLISDIEAEVDIDSFPLDSMGYNPSEDGDNRVSFDDFDKYILFKHKAFLATAIVISENGDAVDQNGEEAKRLLRYAADWIYCNGFSHMVSKCA